MPEESQLVTIRLYPSEKALADKMCEVKHIRGRGRLFASLMREDIERAKQARKVSDTGK